MTTNTEELIKVSVPMFLLAGMDQKGENFSAKVLSHEGTELQLEVGGVTTTTKVPNQKKHFKTNTVLIFDKDGALVGTGSTTDIYKKAAVTKVETAQAPRRTGSAGYRENKLF